MFCIHDADAAGSMIIQSLQEETRSRGRRLVEIIDLGLQPWEAIEMGLPVENVSYERRQPVADYICERTDRDWEEWLQHHRVELNAMSPAELIAWLDRKIEAHGALKVIPPTDVVAQELREELEAEIERQERARILREAETLIAKRTVARLDAATMPEPDELRADVEKAVTTNRRLHWTQYIEDLAAELARRTSHERRLPQRQRPRSPGHNARPMRTGPRRRSSRRGPPRCP